MAFNLVDEPWILAQGPRGPVELSLSEAFEQADDVLQLTGEVPTQAYAILRLLLAICHDAIGWRGDKDVKKLHREGLDVARVTAYLEKYHDRFELFDDHRPFMQVAGLRTAKDEYSGLEKLVADVPNGAPFFTMRTEASLRMISAAEAARWLVHVQAFDASGIRSGAVGDPLVKGGKGYPIGPSWAGQTGGVVLHGATLLETLVCNITPPESGPDDRPFWTRDEPETQLRCEDALPAGPVQTLVWQSRRVRLVGGPDGVVGVVLCQGDKLAPQLMRNHDHMTGWRYSKPQSQKLGRAVYMPNQHVAGRALWRGLPAILAGGRATVEDRGSVHEAFIAPRTIEAADQRMESLVIQTVGIQYGAQNAVIDEIIDDRLEVHPSLLAPGAENVQVALADAVALAEVAVRQVGQLAAQLARAAGEKGDAAGDGARERVMAEAWGALDQPARRWISGLSVQTSVPEARASWAAILRPLLERLADQLVDSAPPAAIRGRQTNFGYMSTHKAYAIFQTALRKHLGGFVLEEPPMTSRPDTVQENQ